MKRLAILSCCTVALLAGPAASAQADTTTQLPFANGNAVSMVVDPSGGHVFVSGGPGSSSIVVLNYSGAIVKTIAGQGGADGMALDSATHTLYVALHDQTAISEINTQTLIETKRFTTAPYPDPSGLVIAGNKLWFSCFQSDGTNCNGSIVSANLDGTGMTQPISGWFFTTVLAAGGSGNHLLAVADTYQEPSAVKVYDVSGSTPTQVSSLQFSQEPAFVNQMAFDPSGANLLLAANNPAYVESLSTSTLLPSGQYPTGSFPISVATTPDGKFVAGGINTNSGPDVFVYPAGKTTPVRTFQVGDDSLSGVDHSLAFSPDASRLFAVARDTKTGHLAFHVLVSPTIPLKPSSTALTKLTPSGGTVRYGSQATLKVKVTGPTAGKVDLYATSSSATNQLVATAGLASGAATFSVKPTSKTTYSAKLEEGSGYMASTSQAVTISVAPAMSVTPRARGTARLHGHKVSRTLLTAKVKPQLPPEPLEFVVQRHKGHGWRTTASGEFPIGSGGTVRAFFYTNKAGKCRVRLVYRGDAGYAPSKSAWKTFRVKALRR